MADLVTDNNAEALRERARNLSGELTRKTLAFGEVLYITHEASVSIDGQGVPLFEAWGFESWDEYVEHELGVHKGTARAWMRMHETFFVKYAGAWDPSLAVSSTKMRALVRVVTRKNVETWLKRAAKLSCCDLEEAILDALYGTGRKGKMHTFKVVVTSRQMSILNTALVVAREDFPKADDRGDALVKVVEEWHNLRSANKGQPRGRRRRRDEAHEAEGEALTD